MAYDTKRRWSGVFVRPTGGEPGHARRLRSAVSAGPTVQATIDEFLRAVDDGWARDRYGRPFTDDDALQLHWYLRGHIAEALGATSLGELRRRDLETLVERLDATGLARRRQRALVRSVQALYDYAIERRLVRGNPAERVAVPDDHAQAGPGALHHGIELVVRIATLGCALTALIFLTETL